MIKYYPMANNIESVQDLFEVKTGNESCYICDIDGYGIYCQFKFQRKIADFIGFNGNCSNTELDMDNVIYADVTYSDTSKGYKFRISAYSR